MACANIDLIRNIGIIAHIDAGKTTLSERILFYCQKIHKLGEVHDGTATMDFMPEEQERGITITSACTTCLWRDEQINLVDTPGHVDFTIEVERCLRVLDGAVGVFCAVGGVEPQSETVWHQSEQFNVPKLAFINKMDRQGANFQAVVDAIRDRLNGNPVPFVMPVGQAESFNGVYDLINEVKLTFSEADQGQTVLSSQLSEDERTSLKPWREQMLEKIAEADDDFLALWMDGNFTTADIMAAATRSVIQRKITPVYCGSALRNIGVQPLLDAICNFLPSPLASIPMTAKEAKDKIVEIKPSPNASPVALVFKVVMENGRKNCFLRLYAGKIKEGEMLCNARSGQQDRISRLYRLHADRREQLTELCAGDIAAAVGLRDAATGDTYCLKNHLVSLESIDIQPPVITLALEPRNSEEGKILDEALKRYLEEDPTLKLELDEESGLRMLSGMGELHLEVVLERLEREYKIKPRSGQPQVVLRETVQGNGKSRFVFDKELGKERHHGEVEVSVSMRERNSGNVVSFAEFLPADPQEARKLIPQAFVDAVREGLNDSLQSGVLKGWPIVDTEVSVTDIKRIEGITTIPGLRMAAAQALRDAILKASPVMLEPIMNVEINTPEEYLGPVISLFNQCGGKVEELYDQYNSKHLKGSAPLRKLFGFSTKLRSSSQGKAGFILAFKTFNIA